MGVNAEGLGIKASCMRCHWPGLTSEVKRVIADYKHTGPALQRVAVSCDEVPAPPLLATPPDRTASRKYQRGALSHAPAGRPWTAHREQPLGTGAAWPRSVSRLSFPQRCLRTRAAPRVGQTVSIGPAGLPSLSTGGYRLWS